MAAIASTDVTVLEQWTLKPYGARSIHQRLIDILLSGNGGTADDIPAATLGFKVIYSAESVGYKVTSNSSMVFVPIIVETDKVGILTVNVADATDSTRSAPANVVAAGTLRVLVTGLRT